MSREATLTTPNNDDRTQMKRFVEFLKTNTVTASQVTEMTGIKQKNICRYKRELEKANLLSEVKKVRCPITGFPAMTLTTDPTKFPTPNQLRIW
jgi:hypothetical protein